jgi:HPt (histidine-containing phosphotransfer) domain-containing protein
VIPADQRAIDPAIIETLRDFLKGADFIDFLRQSREEIALRMASLHDGLTNGDLGAAIPAAHDLVALAGNCGATTVSTMARDIERACRAGRLPAEHVPPTVLAEAVSATLGELCALMEQ